MSASREQYIRQQSVKPCLCGCDDLILWLDNPDDTVDSLNKIECPDCGRVVWGGDDEAIMDWNNEQYDDA